MSEGTARGRVTCPKCSGLNPEIARFCNRCGADLANAEATTATLPPVSGRERKICPGCHRFNAATAAFCTDCGVSLPAHATVPLFGGPAGFWHRAGAFVIDIVILGLLVYFVADRLGLPEADYDRLTLQEALAHDAPSLALNVAFTAVYATIMVGTWGATIGKLLLGLRIVRHGDGSRVPYGLALGRSLAEYLSLIPLGLGYLWVGLSPAKRAWHDYLCDTRVVRVRPD